MALYKKGDRFCVRTNLSIRGVISFVHPHLDGGIQYYDVKRDDGSTGTQYEQEIVLESLTADCWEMIANNSFSSYQDFSIGASLFKIHNASANTIPSLKASRTKFKPYQFKPLVKYLNSSSKRLLIADEVGLGKTIEAGHILLELAGRGLLGNCLIICTKSLQLKWQTELREKFGFEFKICTVPELVNDINRDINSGQRSVMAVINYEKTRNDAFQSIIQQSSYSFDVVICDEAHKLRNSETITHQGVSELMKVAASAVYLTATPVMTDIRNLYNLIKLLEPERYFNFETFKNAVSINRPFLIASNKLQKRVPLLDIADELHEAVIELMVTIGEDSIFSEKKTVSELFSLDPLYNRVRGLMTGGEDTLQIRAKVLSDLTELNSLNHLYSRNRKKEVLTENEVIKRDPHSLLVEYGPEEQRLFDSVIHNYGDGSDSFGMIQTKRNVASSVIAYYSSTEELDRGIYNQSIPDSKYTVFRQCVEEVVVRTKQKMIVFSFFKKTLKYLKIRLEQEGIPCAIIHGDIEDRVERIEQFRSNDAIYVLLSSEVGSEGLDLQFAHVVVNYDLPWNPMVVEQRIGRVDRVGQESKIVNVFSLVLKNTIEEKIYTRLLERIKVFRESIGDLEEILGDQEPISNRIEETFNMLYLTELTEEQQNELIDNVALAIENERVNYEKVSEQLNNSVVYDLYFNDEINSILVNNRYLTEIEIVNFINTLFRLHLTTCHFTKVNENIYRIELPNNNRQVLFNFMNEQKRYLEDKQVLLRQYNQFIRHAGKTSIDVTFNQDFAFQHPKVEYINSFHPLLQCAAHWFKNNAYHQNRSFRIGLSQKELDRSVTITPGSFLLAVYSITVSKHTAASKEVFDYVHSALIDLNADDPIVLPSEVSDYILGKVQSSATSPQQHPEFNQEMVDYLRPIISMGVKRTEESIKENEIIKMRSTVARSISQAKLYYENQINRKETLLREGRGIKGILQSEIAQLQMEYDQKVKSLESMTIECSNTLMSVNYLEIY